MSAARWLIHNTQDRLKFVEQPVHVLNPVSRELYRPRDSSPVSAQKSAVGIEKGA